MDPPLFPNEAVTIGVAFDVVDVVLICARFCFPELGNEFNNDIATLPFDDGVSIRIPGASDGPSSLWDLEEE